MPAYVIMHSSVMMLFINSSLARAVNNNLLIYLRY